MKTFERALVSTLLTRLRSGPNLAQVVLGPRQVGKTTALHQVVEQWPGPSHYASADRPLPPDAAWVESQWAIARQRARASKRSTLLVLDEVQKVSRWGEVVKAQFDRDRHERVPIRVALLGSASLNVRQGAQESLAGRFEVTFCPHWSWPECRSAFGWSLDQWLFFGGYPRAARLIRQPARWASYIADSIVESVVSRDVLQLATVTKPALLRQLYGLAAQTPAHVLSFNKMLGQLQDAGNTVTLAHYLQLLASAFLVSGLNVWSGGVTRQRASSPKLVLWNNALVSAASGLSFKAARARPDWWGHLVENAVGAHLLNAREDRLDVTYWRDGNDEVDFVLERGQSMLGLEIKSGRAKSPKGLVAFRRRAPKAHVLIVGGDGMQLEQFFETAPGDLL